VAPFAVTGRETSMGLHGGVQDTTEKRSRGVEEGDITNSEVDGAVDSASGVVGESPVNLRIHEPAKGGEAGGVT
jgi:hypothetical protein